MKVAVFGTKTYDREFLQEANTHAGHELTFFEARLNKATVPLASGHGAVCVFVNDDLSAPVLEMLAGMKVRVIALRCAGFNNVDLVAAQRLGLAVVRVPEYSPHGVAEHAVALMMALNRKLYRSYSRVREGNFSLEGLLGFNMYGRTIGIVGTGKIGATLAGIMKGFGCRLIAYDPYPNAECKALGVEYMALPDLLAASDIISLHCPLTPQTHHIIDDKALAQMKPGVMLINTGRGALIDTRAVVDCLKSGQIGYLGLDVYEEEGDLFFENLSDRVIKDDVFMRLLTFPNVVITGHQAFFTREAMQNIAETTLRNITAVAEGKGTAHFVKATA